MRFFLLLIISISIFAKTPYRVLESKHNKAVNLWEKGKNQEAFKLFKENNEENHIPSKFFMGLYYLYGFNTVGVSYNKAFDYINESSENGYVDAMLQSSVLYYHGIGIGKNKIKSERILNRIETYLNLLKGQSKSYLLIINNKKYGLKTKKRRALIQEILKTESRLSKINLIFFLRTNPYFLRKYTKAKKILMEEIEKKNSEAQALFYEQYSSKKSAIKILISAAKQGDVNSQYNLYLHYKRKRNKKLKLKWLKIAAQNGDKAAKKIFAYYRKH